MKIVTIDFEGSLKKGIREIGVVISNYEKIIHLEEFIVTNEIECLQSLKNILIPTPDILISHNIHVEKNLLKKYMPYKIISDQKDQINWGPWLDTQVMYQKLYPMIKKYDLINLTKIFVEKKVDELSVKHLSKSKRKHHYALYDAICSFCLFERLIEKIDIRKFTTQ